MIRAAGIRKSFGEQEVLKGIDFTFEAGKTNLIIGRSGAGKTVLLKILVGLFPPTEGGVWYDDKNLLALDRKQVRELRNDVGMLFQGNALFDSMTIEENIRFPMDMFTKMTELEKRHRVDSCLDDITDDNNMTTIINTHDMNSVMEIGENICLLKDGLLAWQGNKDEVLSSTDENLQNFIFASPFLKKLVNMAGQGPRG